MRGHFKILLALIGLAAGGLPNTSTKAVVPDRGLGQYNTIPERNVFGLRPPPNDPLPTNPPAQLPKITLTGITTILGNKRALMMLAPPNLKPGNTNHEISLILTEGQRESEVEVLQIDEKRGSVRVNNSGTVMTLTFEKDGTKLPATPPPRTGAPPPPLPIGVPATTAAATTSAYSPHTRSGVRNIPGRNPRQGQTQTYAPGLTNVTAPVGGIPNPTGLVTPPSPTGAAPEQDLTPEEQAIVNELQRENNRTLPVFGAPAPPANPQPTDATGAVPANAVVAGSNAPVLPQ